jgi:hypothetical protein
MSMVSSYPSSVSRLTQAALAGVLFSSVLWMTAAEAGPLSIALPGERAFPESITSARDGTLFVGRLGEGGVVRANPRTGAVALFVAPGAAGSRSITGVFADEASGTLWACSNDLSALGGPSGGRDRGAALNPLGSARARRAGRVRARARCGSRDGGGALRPGLVPGEPHSGNRQPALARDRVDPGAHGRDGASRGRRPSTQRSTSSSSWL